MLGYKKEPWIPGFPDLAMHSNPSEMAGKKDYEVALLQDDLSVDWTTNRFHAGVIEIGTKPCGCDPTTQHLVTMPSQVVPQIPGRPAVPSPAVPSTAKQRCYKFEAPGCGPWQLEPRPGGPSTELVTGNDRSVHPEEGDNLQ